jgi:hypothetical protein
VVIIWIINSLLFGVRCCDRDKPELDAIIGCDNNHARGDLIVLPKRLAES